MRISLKNVVFLAGAVFMIAPALVAGSMFTDAFQRRAETSNANRLRVLGELAADQLGRRMYQLWRDVEGMARLADMDAPDEMRRQLSFLGEIDPRFSWIGAANVEGTVVAATRGMLEGQSVAQRAWFRRGLSGPTASDVHEALLLAKLMPPTQEPRRFVDFSTPIRSAQGQVTGVLGAHFDWNWVQENIGSYNAPGVDFLLVSRDRVVLSGPLDLQEKTLSVGSAIAAGQATSISLDELWPDGKHYITAVVPTVQHQNMPSFGWSIMVRADADAVLEPTRAIIRSFWMLLGTGAVVALILFYLFANWLATPLRRLIGSAERLANGDNSQPPYEESRYQEASGLSAALTKLQNREMRPYQKAKAPAPQGQ
jgi:HAMP domain-containing protein